MLLCNYILISWSGGSWLAREAHNLEITGSSPVSATNNNIMAQKLSATAKRDKAARDLAFAKTPARRAKKADSQRKHRANPNAKGLDWDHKDQRFESPAKNRGNDGRGTKSEGKANYKITR